MLLTMAALGAKVRLYRKQQGLSQGELAEKAGLIEHYISQIETNKATNLKLDTLNSLAYALNVTINDLFSEDETAIHIVDGSHYEIMEFLKNQDIESLAVLQHRMAMDDDEHNFLLLFRHAKSKGVNKDIEQILQYELKRRSTP